MIFKINNDFRGCIKSIPYLAFLLSFQVSSQGINQIDFFELSLEELMRVDVTIATKTQIKINDVPGMVSILNSLDLEYRGFSTLWESLASLPGIQIAIDSTGSRLLVVRGIGKTYSSGKVKLLLNGVAMNSTINANSEALMNLPVQQIERIELIRGPGSAVHGEFSFAGVINVITKKTGQGLYTLLAEDNSTRIGGYYQWENQKQDLNVSVNFSTSQTDGPDLKSGLDFGSTFDEPAYSSGPVNTKRGLNSLLLNVDYGNIHTSLQWIQAKRGDHFGINDYLPPDERKNRITNESLTFQTHVDFEASSTLKLNLGLNWLESKIAKKHQFVGSSLVFGGLATEPDVVSNVNFAETRVEVNMNLISTALKNHVLFAELSTVKIEVDEAKQFLNLDPDTYLPSSTFFSYETPISHDQERVIASITLQDEFSINPNLILTSGVRYDQYDNDIGTSTTPRLALVYHASEYHSFRTQYAEAFRPPTFLETYGITIEDISPETIKTLEFGYQYQDENTLIKTVLFYSKLKNLITFVNEEPFGFSNTDKASLHGIEFEYAKNINQLWKIDSNLSLLKTENEKTKQFIYGSASVLANAEVTYKLSSKVGINSSFNYVGKRKREENDNRNNLDDYLVSNFSLSIKKLGNVSGLALHTGINNLFNQDIVFQSGIDTYIGDYPFGDSRSLWLQISYTGF